MVFLIISLLYSVTTSIACGYSKLLEFFQTTRTLIPRHHINRNSFVLTTTSTQPGRLAKKKKKNTRIFLPTARSVNDELFIQSRIYSRNHSCSSFTEKSSAINLRQVLSRRCLTLGKLQRDFITSRILLFTRIQQTLLYALYKTAHARLEMHQSTKTVFWLVLLFRTT